MPIHYRNTAEERALLRALTKAIDLTIEDTTTSLHEFQVLVALRDRALSTARRK